MSETRVQSSLARRSFLARLGAGVGVAGASLVSSPAAAAAQATAEPSWHPARHAQDDWLDKIPGVHRLLFDTNTPENLDLALLWASNYFSTSRGAYDLKNSDLAVVIVTRHKSTSFGYNSVMWAKYGKQFSEHSGFIDPQTKQPPTSNLYAAVGDSSTPPGGITRLIGLGAQFAVCSVSSGTIARNIAQATGAQADSVMKELAANLVGNARLVPAGIVAVNRAQERGYSIVL